MASSKLEVALVPPEPAADVFAARRPAGTRRADGEHVEQAVVVHVGQRDVRQARRFADRCRCFGGAVAPDPLPGSPWLVSRCDRTSFFPSWIIAVLSSKGQPKLSCSQEHPGHGCQSRNPGANASVRRAALRIPCSAITASASASSCSRVGPAVSAANRRRAAAAINRICTPSSWRTACCKVVSAAERSLRREWTPARIRLAVASAQGVRSRCSRRTIRHAAWSREAGFAAVEAADRAARP